MDFVPGATVRRTDGSCRIGRCVSTDNKDGLVTVAMAEDNEWRYEDEPEVVQNLPREALEVVRQPDNYIWTFELGGVVQWSGESHDRIKRRMASMRSAPDGSIITDQDRQQVIDFMEHCEVGKPEATFAAFPKFGTVLFFMPGVV